MTEDKRHLDLLATFHYVYAALTVVCSCFPMIYLGIGFALVSDAFDEIAKDPGAKFIGGFFIVFASMMIVLVLVFAVCVYFTGRCLKQRKGYIYCLVISSLMLLNMPFGTCLGIFTICVLMRPSVQSLFEQSNVPLEELQFVDDGRIDR